MAETLVGNVRGLQGEQGAQGVPGTPGVGVPAGGTANQVLTKVDGTDYNAEWRTPQGGGGTSDYEDLTNKPQINGHTLTGNQTGAELGLKESVPITTAEYNALVQVGEDDPNVNYYLTDADDTVHGIPAGGTAGQVLKKSSATDYAAEWATLGTASEKNSTPNVLPNSTDLVESRAVYSAINTALSSVYTPRGDKTVAELTSSLLTSENVGSIYEISDSGYTTALFLQGAGIEITAGDNVGVIQTGPNTYLFNLMSNAFDLHNYQTKNLETPVTIGGQSRTTVEGAIGALNTVKADKTELTDLQPKTLATPLTIDGTQETTTEGAIGALNTKKVTASDTGWVSFGDYESKYRVKNGFCTVRVLEQHAMTYDSNGGYDISGTLPVGARPSIDLSVFAYTYGYNAATTSWSKTQTTGIVRTDGTIKLSAGIVNDTINDVRFTITYPV